MLNVFVRSNKHMLQLLQSFVIFSSWLLIFSTSVFFLFFSLLFFSQAFSQEKILIISTLITFIGLFMLGFVTIKEKTWGYVGWACLTLALCYLMFNIPHGMQLIYLTVLTGLISVASYFGFAYKNIFTSHVAGIFGSIFAVIFISHTVIISDPKKFGVDVQGDEFSVFVTKAVQEVIEMDIVDFIKMDEGRRMAIEVYNTPLLISNSDLEKLVKDNPVPIKKAQQELQLTTLNFINSPYSYIIGVYIYPVLKSSDSFIILHDILSIYISFVQIIK